MAKRYREHTLEQLQEFIKKQETRRTGAFYLMKLKSLLKRKKLIENKCQICGTPPKWNDKKLSLELDHIDGDWRNNSLSNLRFLCPNCHYSTETHSTNSAKTKERNIPDANESLFKIHKKKVNGRVWESMRWKLIREVDSICQVCYTEFARLCVRQKRKRKTGDDLRRQNLEVLCWNCFKAK